MSDPIGAAPGAAGPSPSPIEFDPDTARVLPPGLQLPSGGSAVLLVAAGDDRRWTTESAIALGSLLAATGRRIVLADLHLEHPALDHLLDGEDLEGVVDLFLYGSSLSRTARPVAGRGFYCIPAGTYTSDHGAIFRHPRWDKLIAGFREAEALLVLFAPAAEERLGTLASRVAGAILLDGDGSGEAWALADLPVHARLVPPAPGVEPAQAMATPRDASPPGPPPPSTSAPTAPTALPGGETPRSLPAPPDSHVALPGDPRVEPDHALPPAGGSLGGGAGAAAREETVIRVERATAPEGAFAGRAAAGPMHPPSDPELDLPPPPVRTNPQPRRNLLAVLLLLVVVAILTALAFALVQYRPDLVQGLGLESSVPTSGGPEATAGAALAPTRQGEELPYSIQVRAFTSLPAALDQVAAERRRLDNATFFVSPEDIQGILYFRVMAGAAADTGAALRLRDRLVGSGSIDPDDVVGSWSLIQYAPLAFELGEYPDAGAASTARDSLLALEVPAYGLEVPYSDGTRRWQLYVGAYRDSLSAERMRGMLDAGGIQARLTPRRGLSSPSPGT